MKVLQFLQTSRITHPMTQCHFPGDLNLLHILAVSQALLTTTQTILQYIIV